MKRLLILLVPLCLGFYRSNSQTISTVLAMQEGNKVIISYDLDYQYPVSISLFYSEDGGENFIGPLSSVTGNVGGNVKPGINKRISWDVLSDVNFILGEKITFKVVASKGFSVPSVEVIEGIQYKIISIGDQIWMAENLKKAYGDTYWCYNNSNQYCEKYGFLYTWDNSRKVCPAGWKLPSETDWNALIDFLGGDNIAGGRLKSLVEWSNQNVDATNESNFSSIPGGYRLDNGSYHFIGRSAFYWVSDEFDSQNGKYISLSGTHGQIIRNNAKKNFGFSVRCIKE
jgi:uncharacterized protein (TIGR02145 family)